MKMKRSFKMKNQRTKNRVLLASPKYAFRESISEALQAHGFELLFAETGQRALQVMREHRMDLIILDDRTLLTRNGSRPGKTAVLKTITDANPFFPLVLVCETQARLNHATFLMADAILTRPVDVQALLDAVDTVLEETLQERARRKSGDIRIFHSSLP